MIKHYFKTALRNFLSNKVITIITVLGLSVGISAALVIYQIVRYDYSFDQYEPGRDRIYRVVSEGPDWTNAGVPAPLHDVIRHGVTGVSEATAFFSFEEPDIRVSIPRGSDRPSTIFKKQPDLLFADESYFRVFPHSWLAGSQASALKAPWHLVLSEGLAKRYFPGIAPQELIGRTVVFNDSIPTTISGIVGDLESASDFNSKIFISLSSIPQSGLAHYFHWDRWDHTSSNSQIMVKLSPGATAGQINRQLAVILKEHRTGTGSVKDRYRLQALSDIHFNKDFNGTADKSTLFHLILLAVFLLALGSINFVNLSTARASQRAREIGVRKSMGGSRKQLMIQFLSETFLLTFFATLAATLITPFLFHVFSGFTPSGLAYQGVFQPSILIFLFLLMIGVSLLSGVYPAFILSGLRPVSVLKDQSRVGGENIDRTWLRKTLIIVQFVIAQVFLICTWVVSKQIHFSLGKDMGFRKDAIIYFNVPFDFFKPDQKRMVLLNDLRTLPGVQAASLGSRPPVMNGFSTSEIKYEDGKKERTLSPDMRYGDTAFIGLYHIALLAGRNVLPSDSVSEVLINASLARQLGFKNPGDALGKYIEMNDWQLPIVGVMADFNQASVRTAIHPLLFFTRGPYGGIMHVALQHDPATWKATIARIQDRWKAIYPASDFDYTFLDKSIEQLYQQDIKVSRLLGWSAGVAIFISCLGLLGLVIFLANQRMKEIGIRKVLGASVVQIISLLSVDFIRLVLVASVIAIPIAWWAMNRWLDNFAYHTLLSWWIFILSIVIMLAISLGILALEAGRAAMANPVKALRAE